MKASLPWSRRLGLAALGLALLLALVYVMMRSGPLAPTRVTVVSAAEGRIEPALFGIGVVEARRAYLIGPTTAGRVLKVGVDVGDRVSAGQLLAEMDPVDLDERNAALQASIERAGSAVAAMAAQRQDAQARKALAAINARRYVELGEQQFFSAAAVEAKVQEQASAEAALAGAEANLAAARQDLKRLAAERAALAQQRDNQRLLAPADAVVISREAEPGSTVVAGQAVLRLIEPSSLWLKVRFDQGRSAGLAAGLRAQVVLRSRPSTPLAGKVARVEVLGDSVTEERVAMIAFDNPPASLALGELAEVTLVMVPTEPTLLLPSASLRRQGDQTGVWRIDDGRLSFAPVRVGQSGLDGNVQVLAGLQADDQVVVYSENELGARSRIVRVDTLAGGTTP